MKLKSVLVCVICAALMVGFASQTDLNVSAASEGTDAGEVSLKEDNRIEYVSYYDIASDTETGSYAAELFKKKYGGEIEWFSTTWQCRYSDLAVYILGGQKIDFFPADEYVLPKGIVSQMFIPVDDYIDTDKAVWQKYKNVMELYNFKGKHYNFVTNVTAENVVLYNKKTIKKYKLDDPYELWRDRKWNWDTFEEAMTKFADAEKGRYGLDGLGFEKALFLSAGKPFVRTVKGDLVCNADSKTVNNAMDFGRELYGKGLVTEWSGTERTEHPELIGDGRTLFYISPCRSFENLSKQLGISPKDIGMAPVPSPKGSANYMGIKAEGLLLLSGADNPKGTAQFAECMIRSGLSKTVAAECDKKFVEEYGWTKKLVLINKEINRAARKCPVMDISAGVSSDMPEIFAPYAIGGCYHGIEFDREVIIGNSEMLVKEVDEQLEKASYYFTT